MPSRVFMICDRYESGFGHGAKNDGLDLSKTPHADPEMAEAYQIGYEAGLEAWKCEHKNVFATVRLDCKTGDFVVVHNA